MPHFISFCLKIKFIMRVRLDNQRNCLDYFNSIALKTCPFYRIIRDKPNFSQPKFSHNTGTNTIISFILCQIQVSSLPVLYPFLHPGACKLLSYSVGRCLFLPGSDKLQPLFLQPPPSPLLYATEIRNRIS